MVEQAQQESEKAEKKEEKAEKKVEITEESVTSKVDKGEELTPEEEEFILQSQQPVEGYSKGELYKKKEEKSQESEEESEVKDAEKDEKKAEEDESKKSDEEQAKDEILDDDKLNDREEFLARLDNDLEKEDQGGRADLTNYTKREKAYFHRMLKDRKNRQKAQKELNEAIFREEKLKKQIEKKEKKPDVLEELRKKDPNDYMTTEEVIKLFENQQEEPEEKTETKQPEGLDNRMVKYLQLSDKEAREKFEDYDAVMELSKDIVDDNPEYLKEIAESMKKGENPAVKTYELIKNDKEFEDLYPIAEAKWKAKGKETDKETEDKEAGKEKPEEKQETKKTPDKIKKAEEALEKNKVKTTGNISSGEDKNTDELSMDDILNMSDKEFASLPKTKQDYYLKKFGV